MCGYDKRKWGDKGKGMWSGRHVSSWFHLRDFGRFVNLVSFLPGERVNLNIGSGYGGSAHSDQGGATVIR